MLFDLQGKRRRVIQAVYLTLAVLMGGGLVFFGVGSDVQGGLSDIFTGGDGDDPGNKAIEDRIDKLEERAARGGPGREAALQDLVRDYYALASSQVEEGAAGFPEDARDDLTKAAAAWQRYLTLEKETPDAATANFAYQIYDLPALNQPKEAQAALEIIAADQNDWQSYLRVVQYATLAGDTRTADLAGQKATDLAGKKEKKQVEQLVKQAKKTQAPTGTTTTQGGG